MPEEGQATSTEFAEKLLYACANRYATSASDRRVVRGNGASFDTGRAPAEQASRQYPLPENLLRKAILRLDTRGGLVGKMEQLRGGRGALPGAHRLRRGALMVVSHCNRLCAFVVVASVSPYVSSIPQGGPKPCVCMARAPAQ